MRCLIAVFLSLVAVQAVPLFNVGLGREGLMDEGISGLDELGSMGRGMGLSRGGRVMDDSYSGARRQGSRGGYQDTGYGSNRGYEDHDTGAHQNDYKQVVESHSSSNHNVGSSGYDSDRSHSSGGYNSRGMGANEHGRRFDSDSILI